MRRIRFTAIGPMEKYPTASKLLEDDGWTIEKEEFAKNNQKRERTKGGHHNTYEKDAVDIVFGCFKGNKDITATVPQLQKAMSVKMPAGTVSGCLSKLAKAGKIQHVGGRRSGKWKLA